MTCSSNTGFLLIPVWRPRTENVRADFLSRVATLQLHDYKLHEESFLALDAAWGLHSIDRCANHRSCQPLQGRAAGRFCSLFFHPAGDRRLFGQLDRRGELGLSPVPIHG